jgi:hypothetical protein
MSVRNSRLQLDKERGIVNQDEHFESCAGIAATEMKPDTEMSNVSVMTDLFEINVQRYVNLLKVSNT